MKKVTNISKNTVGLDLNTIEDGIPKTLRLEYGESDKITNKEAKSRQVVRAVNIGKIEVEDVKSTKSKSSSKESSDSSSKKSSSSSKEKKSNSNKEDK